MPYESPLPSSAPDVPASSPLDTLRQRYLAALLAGNRREALRLVTEEGLGAGLDVEALQLSVISAAQAELGRLWQQNRVSVAQEHMATAIAQVTLAHLFQRAPLPPSCGRTVLVACVEGELHDFPARLAADALELAGFEVRFLGADVPLESLLQSVEGERPDLVALSATLSFHVPALQAAVAGVRQRTGGRVPVLVGGHAVSWEPGLPARLGVDGTARDARGLVEQARRLTGLVVPPAPKEVSQ